MTADRKREGRQLLAEEARALYQRHRCGELYSEADEKAYSSRCWIKITNWLSFSTARPWRRSKGRCEDEVIENSDPLRAGSSQGRWQFEFSTAVIDIRYQVGNN